MGRLTQDYTPAKVWPEIEKQDNGSVFAYLINGGFVVCSTEEEAREIAIEKNKQLDPSWEPAK